MRLNLSSDGTSRRPRTTRRLQAPGDDQSSVESDHGHGADRLDKPRQSQPVGGMRFTSQTGRRHDGTLDQLASSPAHPIQVGGSNQLVEVAFCGVFDSSAAEQGTGIMSLVLLGYLTIVTLALALMFAA